MAIFYTNIEEIVDEAVNAYKYMAFAHFLDFIYTSQQGVFKGLTKVVHSTIAVIIAFYVIAIPVGYYLALRLKFGLPGLWVGLILG